MGILLAFFVGWAVGAKAGNKGFEEVVEAARTVQQSEEFAAFVAITRTHLSGALRGIGDLISGESPMPDPGDLLMRVQELTSKRAT